jgi:hypothetical protein
MKRSKYTLDSVPWEFLIQHGLNNQHQVSRETPAVVWLQSWGGVNRRVRAPRRLLSHPWRLAAGGGTEADINFSVKQEELVMSKFKTGQSGNPGGRPKGSLNKATLATQALLEGEAEALTRKVVELAKAGNPMALRLCLERLLPPRKDRPITFSVPKIQVVEDLPTVLGAILAAVARGEITTGEGHTLTAMLEAYRKGIETVQHEARITALEKEKSHGKS